MPITAKDLSEGSVRAALDAALKTDTRLSHADVVDIIAASFDHGEITPGEAFDLRRVLDRSATLLPQSRALLGGLLDHITLVTPAGPSRVRIPEAAGRRVCAFLKRKTAGRFPNLSRDDIGLGLLRRLNRPGLISQGTSSLCGPAALLFQLATDRPEEYARFAIDLYETGRGRIGTLLVEPGHDCRTYRLPTGIDAVDWMTAASLRDSENWFLDYEEVGDQVAGITAPSGLAKWFEAAGFRDVRNRTNIVTTQTSAVLGEVNQLFDTGYRVCLLIGANLLNASKHTSGSLWAEHWVVLRSRVYRMGGTVQCTVFTWGDGNRVVPRAGTLTEEDFLRNFYGYVAAKP